MDIIPYTEGHRIFRESFRKFLERNIPSPAPGGTSGSTASWGGTSEIMKNVVAKNLGL
jgi:hypothetical protein